MNLLEPPLQWWCRRACFTLEHCIWQKKKKKSLNPPGLTWRAAAEKWHRCSSSSWLAPGHSHTRLSLAPGLWGKVHSTQLAERCFLYQRGQIWTPVGRTYFREIDFKIVTLSFQVGRSRERFNCREMLLLVLTCGSSAGCQKQPTARSHAAYAVLHSFLKMVIISTEWFPSHNSFFLFDWEFFLCVCVCVIWRYDLLQKVLFQLEEAEGGFDQFTRSYWSFGVQRLPDNSLFFKEWAPAAEALFLTGDFSKWHLEIFTVPARGTVIKHTITLASCAWARFYP